MNIKKKGFVYCSCINIKKIVLFILQGLSFNVGEGFRRTHYKVLNIYSFREMILISL